MAIRETGRVCFCLFAAGTIVLYGFNRISAQRRMQWADHYAAILSGTFAKLVHSVIEVVVGPGIRDAVSTKGGGGADAVSCPPRPFTFGVTNRFDIEAKHSRREWRTWPGIAEVCSTGDLRLVCGGIPGRRETEVLPAGSVVLERRGSTGM